MTNAKKTRNELLAENLELRLRLEEAEETLNAIRSGAVDALVISRPEGEQIFTLQGAETPYRVLVESMNEGAASLDADGNILYCNSKLAAMLQVPLERLMGTRLASYVVPGDRAIYAERLERCAEECDRVEISLIQAVGDPLPALFSCCAIDYPGGRGLGVVLTDIRIQKEAETRIREAQLQKQMAEERERTAEALRQNTARLQTFFDHRIGGIGIVIANARGDIIQANDYYLDILGCTREEWRSGQVDWRKMTPPEWLPADERALAQLRERDVCDLYEKEYQRRDGTRVPILICNAMMPGDNGDILAFVLDITQRKQVEEDLVATHRLMQDLIDNTTSMIFACDLEERFVLANAPLAALLKTTPAQLVGKRRYEVMPQADADAHEANDQEAIAAGRAMEFEEHSDLHGRTITWMTTKFPLRDAQGRIYGVAGIVTDITERKRAIEALNKSNAQLRAIFDTVPIALAITDSQGGNIQTNQAFDKLWGEPRPTAASVNDYVVYKAWWIESGEPVLPEKWASARAVQKGETITGQMMRIERFDGSSAFIHNSAAPILDETGKITGSIVAIMDISKLVQAEEALRRAYADMEAKVVERTRELREKDQMLIMQSRQAAMGEMISNIAHQWRQPLNSLGLVIQQLPLFYEKGQLDGYLLTKNVRNSMEIIKHMSATIEDFRNFFKPDREKADFRLKDVIDHLLSLIKESFENNRIRIKVVENADPVVHGFQNELAQSLLNILNNARDTFIERGCDNPAVTITIASQDGKNVITIADNAGGIPEEIITKVFDPYFTTKGPQHGTGVGLYMSKAIIEKNMGGRLSARNTGDGAEFRIEL